MSDERTIPLPEGSVRELAERIDEALKVARGMEMAMKAAIDERDEARAELRTLTAKEPDPPALAQTRGDMVLMDARVISRLFEALQIYNTDSNWVMGGIFDPNSPKFEGPLVAFRALKGVEED
jgi:hypothetical protein